MKRIIFIILVLISFSAIAENFQTIIDSANANYTQGNYELAIEKYNHVLDEGYEAAEVYYNLGNAYFRSNKTTKAIINFERALKLNPNDEDIQFNLQLSKQYVVDKIDILPDFFLTKWYRSFVKMFSSDMWAFISMLSFVLGLIFLLLYFLLRHRSFRKFGFWFGLFFIFISISTFTFSNKQKQLAQAQEEAIVITPTVTVKSSPDRSGTDLFVIHEGLKVTITDELGEWQEIKLTDGSQGWLKVVDLEVI
jgi:tetratricopeptide (TPR) repeat protein